MPDLAPGIHVFAGSLQAWMAATNSAMTIIEVVHHEE